MSDRGYIYVLINPLMAGLVKVGKTTRDPEERAAELSSSTGIPVPFIVAYQREVSDCTRAEEFVHSYLTDMGCRVSDNREFFRVDLTTAINAVLEYCKLENSFDGTFPTRISDDDPDDIFDDELEDDRPLYEIEEELGDNYYYGFDDYIEDYDEALKHYKLAIKYGSTTAYRSIGIMYFWGDGVKENHATALKYFKQGIEHGDYLCYAKMIHVYLADDNKKNADKCLYKAMKLCSDEDKIKVCYEYIDTCLTYKVPIDLDKIGMMFPHRLEIIERFCYTGDDESVKEIYRKKKQYVQEVIFGQFSEDSIRETEENLGNKYLDAGELEEAFKHFKLAMQYGSVEALKEIGDMLDFLGSRIDKQDRLDLLRYCEKYFVKAMKVSSEENKPDVCFNYIDFCLEVDIHYKIKRDKIEMMRPYKDEIVKRCSSEGYANWVRALFD